MPHTIIVPCILHSSLRFIIIIIIVDLMFYSLTKSNDKQKQNTPEREEKKIMVRMHSYKYTLIVSGVFSKVIHTTWLISHMNRHCLYPLVFRHKRQSKKTQTEKKIGIHLIYHSKLDSMARSTNEYSACDSYNIGLEQTDSTLCFTSPIICHSHSYQWNIVAGNRSEINVWREEKTTILFT